MGWNFRLGRLFFYYIQKTLEKFRKIMKEIKIEKVNERLSKKL